MKIKRFLSKLLIISLLVGMVPTSTVMVKADTTSTRTIYDSDHKLAYYQFDAVSGSAITITDNSGNGNDATIVGTGSSIENGALTLPGGSSGSGKAYVKLPTGMFDNQNTLTISTWIKNTTGKGNYAGLYFGTTENNPSQYWLFNPCNPSGNFKSVMTGSKNTGSPWNTEYGISPTNASQGIPGPSTNSSWALYTTVIEPTTVQTATGSAITAYYNGEKIGTVNVGRTVSDFGTNLVGYIGRSSYPDNMFSGSVDDLIITTEAATEDEVRATYKYEVLKQDKDLLELGISTVKSDLQLPSTGTNGSAITWKSSDTKYITDSGVVTRPAAGKGNVNVTLTATLSLGGVTVTKDFPVSVEEKSTTVMGTLEELQLPYVIDGMTKLPTIDGATITWNSGNTNVISNEGIINKPDTTVDVSLKAKITVGTETLEKEFTVKVMGKDANYIAAYTRDAGDSDLDNSMHLAFSEDGTGYSELNNNQGVLFAKAITSETSPGTTKLLKDPYIFRMADGKFGVIATRINSNGLSDSDGDAHSILFFTSEDLIQYTEVGVFNLDAGKTVTKPTCEYRPLTEQYYIQWKAGDGAYYYNTTKDFHTFSSTSSGKIFSTAVVSTGISGATDGYVLPVKAAEGNKIYKKLSPVVNTTVSYKSKIQLKVGDDFDKSMLDTEATVNYSDGTSTKKSILWDNDSIRKVKTSKDATYRVTGTLKQTNYNFPMIGRRADPNVIMYKGKYYFIATNENGQKDLLVREADTINGLANATDQVIFKATSSGNLSGCIWAPEFHEINGELYIFFAAGTNGTWNTVQSNVMKLKQNGDVTDINSWEEPQRVLLKDGVSYLYTQGITLDMTYFKSNDTHYVIWAQRYIGATMGPSDLWIATINPEKPWILTSDPVKISTPDYGWDRNTTEVDEGPYVLQHNGKIFVTFSGSGTNQTYCIGLLSATAGNDLLDADNWVKSNYPILTSAMVEGQFGPGHNSFTVDKDGNDVLIFHAQATTNGSRDMGARTVYWGFDGTPVLDMTDNREVSYAYKPISVVVTVGNGNQDKTIGGKLLTYVTKGDTTRTDSLHYAYTTDGKNYTKLNNNKAVLYSTVGTKQMGNPVVFAKADGTYGLIATDNNKSSYVMLYDSTDLIRFTNERYVKLNTKNINITDIDCKYSNATSEYLIYWTGSDSKTYLTKTKNWTQFSDPITTDYTMPDVKGAVPDGAMEATSYDITSEELARLTSKFGAITCTGLSSIPDLKVKKGETLENLPASVEAVYSNGEKKTYGVTWNKDELSAVDTSVNGTYTVTGKVNTNEYTQVPLIEERADPYIVKSDDGYYYFMGSYPVRGDSDSEGYDRLTLRRSTTLAGLVTAKEVTIWTADKGSSGSYFRYIWAPELHKIGDSWYIFTTASNSSSNVWGIRPYILKATGDNLMDSKNWTMLGQMKAKATDSAFTRFSLDMTYFKCNGKSYVAWAEINNVSSIYLATVDPSNPQQLTSNAVLVSAPQYAWETSDGTTVDEGPVAIQNNGKIYLYFSASAVDKTYCLGMVSADITDDLTDASVWKKNAYPLLTTDDLVDQYGPGHNSFTKDDYGNTVIVYHARPEDCANGLCPFGSSSDLNDPCRHTRIKQVFYDIEGEPVLNVSEDNVLPAQYKTVTAKIIVSQSSSNAGGGVNTSTPGSNTNTAKPENKETAKIIVGDQTLAAPIPIKVTIDSKGIKTYQIELSEDQAKAAVTSALSDEKDRVILDLTGIVGGNIKNSDHVKIHIPKESAILLSQNRIELAVKHGQVNLQLPTDTIEELLEDITITVSEHAGQRTADTKKVLQQLSPGATMLSNPVGVDTNYALKTKVTVPIPDSDIPIGKKELKTFITSLAVLVEHSDGENRIQKGTIEYDGVGNPAGVSIWVDKFSTFTLVKTSFDGKVIQIKNKQDVKKSLTVTYSKKLDSTTVTEDSVYILDSKGNKMNAVLKVNGNKIVVKPAKKYAADKTYSIYITKNVHDKSGKAVEAREYIFKTKKK